MELRIRDLREDADLSQQEIADLLNVSQTTSGASGVVALLSQ